MEEKNHVLNTGQNDKKRTKVREELPVPRGRNVPKRKISEDAVYGSVLLQRFMNKLMMDGKKEKAESIIYRAFDQIKEKAKQEPIDVFNKAIENITPLVDVKARRVGGATYQVPVEVSKVRGQALAMQWLRDCSRKRGGKSMVDNLASELLDASNGQGGAIKMKEDKHKTAEANKAFAHFRW
jgi:small subunit ribosomal protein S7